MAFMWGFVIRFGMCRGYHKRFFVGRCRWWMIHRCRWAVMCRRYFVGWGRCNMCNGSDIFSVMKAENLFKASTTMFRWRISFKGCMMCNM